MNHSPMMTGSGTVPGMFAMGEVRSFNGNDIYDAVQ